MLIKINEKGILTLLALHLLVMKSIFDRGATSATELWMIEEGVEAYTKMVDLPKHQKHEVLKIVNALLANEHGYFDRAKLLFIEHRIDYLKFYTDGLPFIHVEGRKTWNKK